MRDHGPGLDEDALEHVFDRFWQKDTSRSSQGAGLGLAIVAAVAAEHDGSVNAANTPDGGAVFTVRLAVGALLFRYAQQSSRPGETCQFPRGSLRV